MPDSPSDDTITIQGTVSDAMRSRPGVTVTLSSLGVTIAEVVTDERGRYEFRNVIQGEDVVSIREISEWACLTRRVVTVSSHGITANFFCATQSNPTRVVGTVTVNGFPASSRVVVLQNGAEVRSAVTDAAGDYFFGNIAGGEYSLSVDNHNINCPANQSVTASEATTVRADLACTGQVVTGRFVVNGGSPGAGAIVALCEGPMRDSAHCDRVFPTTYLGRYTYTDLSPGSYFVRLESYPFPGVECPAGDPVAVEAGATAILDLICIDENPWDY